MNEKPAESRKPTVKSADILRLDAAKFYPQGGGVHPAKLRGSIRKSERYADISLPDMFGRAMWAGDVALYARTTHRSREKEADLRLVFISHLSVKEGGTPRVAFCMFKNAGLLDLDELTLRNSVAYSLDRFVKVNLEDYRHAPFYIIVQVMRQRLAIRLGCPKIKNRGWSLKATDYIEKAIKEHGND